MVGADAHHDWGVIMSGRSDDALERAWGKLEARRLEDWEDEEEGVTELIQVLGAEELEPFEGDTGAFSLEEPELHSDGTSARQYMPHTPEGAMPRSDRSALPVPVLAASVAGLLMAGVLIGWLLA